MNLQNSVALITGGASGLGAGTARRFAAAGAKVVLADVSTDAGNALATELGESATFVQTDVTSEDAAQDAVNTVLNQFGKLDILVNCAGIAIGERVVGREAPHSLASFTRVISINLIGSFNVARLAASVMAQQDANDDNERGVIINTTSVAAYDGQIGQAAYSASKGGVVGMTLPMARELARFGIRVMTIAPGIFDTAMLASMPDTVRESLAANIPFPSRLGTPEDYASLAQHIVENVMLNGEVIRLDGAVRLAPK